MAVETIVFAVIIATVLTLLFAAGLQRTGPWSSWLVFFLLVFLVAWAAGLWVSPRGPMVLGVYWLPILLAAVLFAVFLAAATPSARRPPEPPPDGVPAPDSPAERRRQWNVDVFFWVLLVAFVTVIVLGYVVQNPPAA